MAGGGTDGSFCLALDRRQVKALTHDTTSAHKNMLEAEAECAYSYSEGCGLAISAGESWGGGEDYCGGIGGGVRGDEPCDHQPISQGARVYSFPDEEEEGAGASGGWPTPAPDGYSAVACDSGEEGI